MIIRKACLENCPALQALIEQLGYPLSLEQIQQNTLAYLQDPDRELFVAELKGKVVGCLALDIAQTFHHAGKQMRIVSLVIDQTHRRLGIGAQLLTKAEEVAQASGCWIIELTSAIRRSKEGVYDFYESHGYVRDPSTGFFSKKI